MIQLHNKAYSCLLSSLLKGRRSPAAQHGAGLRHRASRFPIGLARLCRSAGVCLFQLVKTQHCLTDGPQGSARRVASAAKSIHPTLPLTARLLPRPVSLTVCLLCFQACLIVLAPSGATLHAHRTLQRRHAGRSTGYRCATQIAPHHVRVQLHSKAYSCLLSRTGQACLTAADLQQRGTLPACAVVRAGSHRPGLALPQWRCVFVAVCTAGPQREACGHQPQSRSRRRCHLLPTVSCEACCLLAVLLNMPDNSSAFPSHPPCPPHAAAQARRLLCRRSARDTRCTLILFCSSCITQHTHAQHGASLRRRASGFPIGLARLCRSAGVCLF